MKKIIFFNILVCLLVTTSCGDWLNVTPKTRTEQGEMFSTEKGFQDALIGVYIAMKSKTMYGKALTLDFVENLAQHWKNSAGSTGAYINSYSYDNKDVEAAVRSIYSDTYNTIANANNILNFVGNGVLNENLHNAVKGELLAVRAFCHLDMLRLFGPVPGTQNGDKILGYMTTISRESLPLNTWSEYILHLEKDLNEAEILLKKVDSAPVNDSFFKYRENRMNYWAVLALKARFYMWVQKPDLALKYAKILINDTKFRLSKGEDFSSNDLTSFSEHILSMHIFDIDKTVDPMFFRPGGVQQTESLVNNDLFEKSTTDYRKTYLWNLIVEERGSRYTLKKYQQTGVAVAKSQVIPLLRLSEMYLIAIECTESENDYEPYVKAIVQSRNISNYNVSSPESKLHFITMEYQREFYGEGQQFFYYKRINSPTIMWSAVEISGDTYVIPLPKGEI